MSHASQSAAIKASSIRAGRERHPSPKLGFPTPWAFGRSETMEPGASGDVEMLAAAVPSDSDDESRTSISDDDTYVWNNVVDYCPVLGNSDFAKVTWDGWEARTATWECVDDLLPKEEGSSVEQQPTDAQQALDRFISAGTQAKHLSNRGPDSMYRDIAELALLERAEQTRLIRTTTTSMIKVALQTGLPMTTKRGVRPGPGLGRLHDVQFVVPCMTQETFRRNFWFRADHNDCVWPAPSTAKRQILNNDERPDPSALGLKTFHLSLRTLDSICHVLDLAPAALQVGLFAALPRARMPNGEMLLVISEYEEFAFGIVRPCPGRETRVRMVELEGLDWESVCQLRYRTTTGHLTASFERQAMLRKEELVSAVHEAHRLRGIAADG